MKNKTILISSLIAVIAVLFACQQNEVNLDYTGLDTNDLDLNEITLLYKELNSKKSEPIFLGNKLGNTTEDLIW